MINKDIYLSEDDLFEGLGSKKININNLTKNDDIKIVLEENFKKLFLIIGNENDFEKCTFFNDKLLIEHQFTVHPDLFKNIKKNRFNLNGKNKNIYSNNNEFIDLLKNNLNIETETNIIKTPLIINITDIYKEIKEDSNNKITYILKISNKNLFRK